MKNSILTIVFFLFYTSIFACSCFPYNSNFYQNVSKFSHNGVVRLDSTYNIPLGNNRFLPMGKFKLLNSFNFIDKVVGDDILMFGQNGVNCAVGFSQFNIGDTLVVALAKSNGDYFIPTFDYACGVHYIKITNGKHNGLNLSAIEQQINQLILSVIEPAVMKQNSITIFPNPVKDMIRFTTPLPQNSVVKILSADGKLLYQEIMGQNKREIRNLNLTEGLYLINIQTNEMNKTLRFLKTD